MVGVGDAITRTLLAAAWASRSATVDERSGAAGRPSRPGHRPPPPAAVPRPRGRIPQAVLEQDKVAGGA